MCRAVQNVAPQPPLVMKTSDAVSSISATHEGWRKRIRDEKHWNNVPSHDVVQSVMKQMRALLSEAREKSLNEFDDVSLEEFQSELLKWGNSLGLPSDWVPPAALRSGQVAVDKLVWAVVCKIWRLAVRPQP